MLRFITVADRTPRAATFCALCCEPIDESYLREIQTRLIYCCAKHYFDHCKVAVALIEHRAREVS
jgi:hypothetical protein